MLRRHFNSTELVCVTSKKTAIFKNKNISISIFQSLATFEGKFRRVNAVSGLRSGRPGDRELDSRRWKEVILFNAVPRRLQGLPSILSNGSAGSVVGDNSGRSLQLTSHLHLMPKATEDWCYTVTPLISPLV